jgi:hypothetical protein
VRDQSIFHSQRGISHFAYKLCVYSLLPAGEIHARRARFGLLSRCFPIPVAVGLQEHIRSTTSTSNAWIIEAHGQSEER